MHYATGVLPANPNPSQSGYSSIYWLYGTVSPWASTGGGNPYATQTVGGAPPRLSIPGLINVAYELQGLVKKKTISDCEALAEFADAAATSNTASGFVQDFGLLTPKQFASTITGVGTASPPIYMGTGQPSGYLLQYQNTPASDSSDQGHHFAAFFQLGFLYGAADASAFAIDFEILEAGFNFQNINFGDISLGIAAAELGAEVKSGAISPGSVGTWIRQNLCAK